MVAVLITKSNANNLRLLILRPITIIATVLTNVHHNPIVVGALPHEWSKNVTGVMAYINPASKAVRLDKPLWRTINPIKTIRVASQKALRMVAVFSISHGNMANTIADK